MQSVIQEEEFTNLMSNSAFASKTIILNEMFCITCSQSSTGPRHVFLLTNNPPDYLLVQLHWKRSDYTILSPMKQSESIRLVV